MPGVARMRILGCAILLLGAFAVLATAGSLGAVRVSMFGKAAGSWNDWPLIVAWVVMWALVIAFFGPILLREILHVVSAVRMTRWASKPSAKWSFLIGAPVASAIVVAAMCGLRGEGALEVFGEPIDSPDDWKQSLCVVGTVPLVLMPLVWILIVCVTKGRPAADNSGARAR
jgi:hypothetical protein